MNTSPATGANPTQLGFVSPPSRPAQGPPAAVISSQPVRSPVTASPKLVMLPPSPSRYACPSCKADIETRVDYQIGNKTHLVGCLLCLFGCWCCVPIPYFFTNSLKYAHHYCPYCDEFIGVSAK